MKEKKQPKKRLGISLDQYTFDMATEVAHSNGRSVSGHIVWVLKRHLAEIHNAEPLETNEQQKQ